MPIYKKNGKAVLFVHIPKSAGTTVDHIFLSNGWQVTFQDGGGRADTILRHLKCSFQHFHATLLTQMINPNSFDAVFTILRDPISRLQSEYRWRMEHGSGPQMEFNAWVTRMFRAYYRNRFVLDNHIRPQRQFILPGAQITALENGLEHTISGLSARLGEQLQYDPNSRRNTSKRGAAEISTSAMTAWLIRRFYARDFALHRRALGR
ncbi:sulfotransferase family 2 domain-containing protein [Parasedimentitalea psychrophila]|uniref:Sulfotransferase family 2 domain-containing protein n=1 Tax=Parasedimentitalea psychrophila TaxID=2997337 RepID=A0A9Y2KVQ7_9RHOB|nr:sulfotransferase family 2 domain-containing protein [Parasedimentitalea psychrophila]WIY23424.1 sulfotransferase family 2 domain-containing protein [Parasedimentitalea psychrophila]